MSEKPKDTAAKIRRHIIFRGRVQGVGFRYTTASLARRFPVSGFVRNLPDGTVELVVEGAAPHVAAFVEEIQRAFEGYISDSRSTESAATGEFDGFGIRY